MNISVRNLRLAGYKVRVIHNRLVMSPTMILQNPTKPWAAKPRLMPLYEIKSRKYHNYVLAKGGKVEVEVTTPSGLTVKAHSECSKQDSYVKREGLNIALGRAFSEICKREPFTTDAPKTLSI